MILPYGKFTIKKDSRLNRNYLTEDTLFNLNFIPLIVYELSLIHHL